MAWVNGPEQRQSETLLEFQSHGYETEACHRSHLERFSGTPYQAHKTTAGEHGSSFSTEVTVMVPQHGGERSSRSTAALMRSDCKLHESGALPVFHSCMSSAWNIYWRKKKLLVTLNQQHKEKWRLLKNHKMVQQNSGKLVMAADCR